MLEEKKEVVIIGAGLVGSLLAICLADRGYKVTIFEKRQDPRSQQSAEGRSINLALSERGIKALKTAGIYEEVMAEAVPMKGRLVHEVKGSVSFHAYGEEGKMINSVSRFHLNKLLIRKAEERGVKLFFDMACTKVMLEKKTLELSQGGSSSVAHFQYDYLFGADGAFSRVRKEMMEVNGFNFSQEYINYGYKELHIPAKDGKHVMEVNGLHIWPRGDFMMIALPNLDGSFTGTIFLPFKGEHSFERLQSKEAMIAFFSQYFPDLIPIIPDLEDQFFHKKESYMVTIHCHPWVFSNHSAIIGDASHAIVPFFGQGMNAGFEDISVLLNEVDNGKALAQGMGIFNDTRKKDADAIAELALNNFVEMRDKVADPAFLLRKKIEAKLHEQFPEYLSLYSMVTFSDMPYADALENGYRQNRMFEEMLLISNIESTWETPQAWSEIRKNLQEILLN